MTKNEYMTVLQSMSLLCRFMEANTCECGEPDCQTEKMSQEILCDIAAVYPIVVAESGIDPEEAPMKVKWIDLKDAFMVPGGAGSA